MIGRRRAMNGEPGKTQTGDVHLFDCPERRLEAIHRSLGDELESRRVQVLEQSAERHPFACRQPFELGQRVRGQRNIARNRCDFRDARNRMGPARRRAVDAHFPSRSRNSKGLPGRTAHHRHTNECGPLMVEGPTYLVGAHAKVDDVV